jgi:hypothetical protein
MWMVSLRRTGHCVQTITELFKDTAFEVLPRDAENISPIALFIN